MKITEAVAIKGLMQTASVCTKRKWNEAKGEHLLWKKEFHRQFYFLVQRILSRGEQQIVSWFRRIWKIWI